MRKVGFGDRGSFDWPSVFMLSVFIILPLCRPRAEFQMASVLALCCSSYQPATTTRTPARGVVQPVGAYAQFVLRQRANLAVWDLVIGPAVEEVRVEEARAASEAAIISVVERVASREAAIALAASVEAERVAAEQAAAADRAVAERAATEGCGGAGCGGAGGDRVGGGRAGSSRAGGSRAGGQG